MAAAGGFPPDLSFCLNEILSGLSLSLEMELF
jgi:hypothetical protein